MFTHHGSIGETAESPNFQTYVLISQFLKFSSFEYPIFYQSLSFLCICKFLDSSSLQISTLANKTAEILNLRVFETEHWSLPIHEFQSDIQIPYLNSRFSNFRVPKFPDLKQKRNLNLV